MDLSNAPMKVSEDRQTSLAQDWFVMLRHGLSNRWVLIGIAAVAIVAAVTFNWGWLVAAGLAPFVLMAASCGTMCALGLCMNKGKKGGASAEREAAGDASEQTLKACCGGASPEREAAGNEKTDRDSLSTTTQRSKGERALE